MAEFVQAVANDLVSGGIGGLYASPVNDVSIQVDVRRPMTALGITDGNTIVLVNQSAGGVSFPKAEKELQAFQVLVDGDTIDNTRTVARQVYDRLHERTAEMLGEHKVLWMRAVAPPQFIAGAPTETRYQMSVNFGAMLVLA